MAEQFFRHYMHFMCLFTIRCRGTEEAQEAGLDGRHGTARVRPGGLVAASQPRESSRLHSSWAENSPNLVLTSRSAHSRNIQPDSRCVLPDTK